MAMERLTEQEIAFFKREGYLFKRGVMDPELMARARDRLWVGAHPRMKRDDPNTWIGPFRPKEENEGPENTRKGHAWLYRDLCKEESILRMSTADAKIWNWTEQLLGPGEVQPPERIRGIYCRLPMAEEPKEPVRCHCDAFNPEKVGEVPVKRILKPRLGLIGLVAAIPPSGGAFTVWPKTHRLVYEVFKNYEGPERQEVYDEHIEAFNKQTPMEAYGEAGDVLFWHSLLAHTAGYNRSKEIQIREALLADFDKIENQELESQRPHDDMWLEWSEETRAIEIDDF